MNLLIVILLLLSGLLVSAELLAESSGRVASAKRRYELASSVEEGIRYKREPMTSILGEDSFKELAESGGEVSKLVADICSSDYDAALNCAALLKIYTEKEMRKTAEREMRSRPMMAYLPPAAAALAAILLL